MPKIAHFLIGIPASGKSTFANHLATLTQGEIISTDAIRASLYGDETIQGNWEEIETELIRQITDAISQNKPVIYDATNAERAWRLDILQKLKSLNLQWMAWHLKPNLATCYQRNRIRQRIVSEKVIEKMYQSLQNFPPISAKGFIVVETLKETDWNLDTIQTILNQLPRHIVNYQTG